MPTYCYRCLNCKATSEVVRPMKKYHEPFKCPECGIEMVRNYAAERPNIGDKEYSRPIHSDSLAIMPSQVEEHKKKFPNIKLDSECRPIFDNYREHQKYLDATGFRKARQQIKRRGKKLT